MLVISYTSKTPAVGKFLLVLCFALLTSVFATPEADADEATINYGGALRYNYFYKSWDGQEANQDKGGDIALDTFRLEADGTYKDLSISAEYRFYAGYHMLHHGYIGWHTSDSTSWLIGVSQVPFGIQPYASHNWFFDVGYYVGLEDDYDAGLQYITRGDNWDLKLGFFKNDEGNYTGNSMDSARYSLDVVSGESMPLPGGDAVVRRNEETNQFNARYAYTLDHGSTGSTELGISGEFGMLYNADTAESGNHTAYGVHAVGNYGKFNLMASYIMYNHDLELPEDDPIGDTVVAYGAYDAPYWIAAEGSIVIANVAYTPGIGLGPFESLTFYNDFSMLTKSEDGFEDTLQNVTGFSAAAGPLYWYFDFAMGQNHPWIGGSWSYGLAQGVEDADWEYRFNINMAYYF